MIAKLITEHRQLSGNLALARHVRDKNLSIELERKIDEIWIQLLTVEPSNQDDNVLLVKFLFNQLRNNSNLNGDAVAIKKRITKLFSFHPL